MRKTGPKPLPPEDRFWASVDKSGPDGCWVWTAYKDGRGYGDFGLTRSRTVKAHRFSWEISHGPIPKGRGYHGTCVLHRCDNPACVNPDHLFLGSHQDNMADMKAKGRAPHKAGPLTTRYPLVQSYRNRHGKPVFYFRVAGQKRIRLPDISDPRFDVAYENARRTNRAGV